MNMGAAENEYHEKMQRLALQRDRASVTEPTDSDLAADVRAVLPPRGTPHHEMPRYMQRDQQRTNAAHVALDALVAQVDTLTRERDEAQDALQALAQDHYFAQRAAEAALADARRALEQIANIGHEPGLTSYQNIERVRRAARRALAAGDET